MARLFSWARNVAGISATSTANCRFAGQGTPVSFIRTHNETLSVAAMRVNNPDRSPVAINR